MNFIFKFLLFFSAILLVYGLLFYSWSGIDPVFEPDEWFIDEPLEVDGEELCGCYYWTDGA